MRNTPTPQHQGWWAGYIATLRELAGWTQAEMARALEVDRATISRWERGLTTPEPAMIINLAHAMDRPVDEAMAAAGWIPTGEEIPTVALRPEIDDPDLRRLVDLFQDANTPDVVREQIRATIRALAELAEAQPPRKRQQRRRTA